MTGWWIAACRPPEEVALEAERAAQPPAAEVEEPAPERTETGRGSGEDTSRIPVFETGPADSASVCEHAPSWNNGFSADAGGRIYEDDSGNTDSGERWARLGRRRSTAVPGPCVPGRDPLSNRALACPIEEVLLTIRFPPVGLPPSLRLYRGVEPVDQVTIDPSTVTSAIGSLVVRGGSLYPENSNLVGTPGWASPAEAPSPGGLRVSEIQLLPRNYDLIADFNCDGGVDSYLDRFVELANTSDQPLNLGDHLLSFGSAEALPLPSWVLSPGARVVLFPEETRDCRSATVKLTDVGSTLHSSRDLEWVGGVERPEGYRVLGLQRKASGINWIEQPLPEPGAVPSGLTPLTVALVADGGARMRAQPAGDLDGDGLDDLLLLEPNALKVAWGPFGPHRAGELEPGFLLREGGLRLADSRALGDLDGDGHADLAIPGRSSSPARLELVSIRGRSGLGEVWASIEEPCATLLMHRSQGWKVGDLTGDGVADLVVHSPKGTTGRLALFAGPLAAVETTLNAEQLWTDDLYDETLIDEELTVLVGDPVGDGQPRMLVHSPERSMLLLDPLLPGSVPTSAARARSSSGARRANLADLDGDGVQEVLGVWHLSLWAHDLRLGGTYTRNSSLWTTTVSGVWGGSDQLLVREGSDGLPDLVLVGREQLYFLPTMP